MDAQDLWANDPDPIAVVGSGCRYPGVSSPDDLWELVSEGRDAITQFPTDRGWDFDVLFGPDPEAPGATGVRGGGFVEGVGDFDASFFGISPREAQAIDPQQRLLLEVGWEALEQAGIDPTSLHGTDTGVFVGAGAQEYGPRIYDEHHEYAGHLTTGTTVSVTSGRIAYTLGLTGPAVTVDTSCSASLVALHLAVRSLRSGECGMALVGGVTVVCSPSIYVGFNRLGALSADGRCKPFSAAADGFGVAEGVGVVVLTRLSHARRLGYPVLALIRGTAVGQDGASNGLSAPDSAAQERVIRHALADAGLAACDIDVVEAHGTGTPVGDPIELRALQTTYGAAHTPARPLLLGSVKSNIGHSQQAAGMAGIIKMLQAIRHGVVPATLHVDSLTPQVDWSPATIDVVRHACSWPDQDNRPRRCGVSAFGVSGTNAHVILEQAPLSQPVAAARQSLPVTLWPLSAKSGPALAQQAARLHSFVERHPDLAADDIAGALVTTRALFDHRAVVVGAGRDELLGGLAAIASGAPAPEVVTGKAVPLGKTVFVFPGQGSQWVGMAVDLLESAPVFSDQMRACEAAFSEFVDWSLLDVVRGSASAPDLSRVDVVQPVLFAVLVSLAAQWRALGVHPDAVIGHSQGEIAAAYVAGALSLRDAAKIVTLRSKAIRAVAGNGGMASIALTVDRVRALIEPWRESISVAAHNGPSATVIAGPAAALDEVLARCERDGVRATRIQVDYASHSVAVAELRETLAEALDGLAPQACDTVFVSSVTGAALDTTQLDGTYWYTNLRQTVQFEQAVRWAHDHGYRAFIEVSPHPVLTFAIEESLEDHVGDLSDEHCIVPTLRRDEGGMDRFLLSAAAIHVQGSSPDWASMFADTRRVELPTYAFQRKRYWMHAPKRAIHIDSLGIAQAKHPMLGAVVPHAGSNETILTGRLSLATHPWLADHAVHGVVLVPGAVLVELALYAGQRSGCPQLDELVLLSPLLMRERRDVNLQVVIGAVDNDGTRPVKIYSHVDDGDTGERDAVWTRHAEGVLTPVQTTHGPDEFTQWPPIGAEQIDVSDAYTKLAARGYHYGPVFRGLRSVWCRGTDAFVEAVLPEQARPDRFTLHPVLLDAILHGIDASGILGESELTLLPFAWHGVWADDPGVATTELRAKISVSGDNTVAVQIADNNGVRIAGVHSVALRAIAPGQLVDGDDDALYGLDWVTSPSPKDIVVADDVTVLRCPSTQNENFDSSAARHVLDYVLKEVQHWLADSTVAEETRLVVLTCRGIAVDSADTVQDLAHAAVWGLLRTAQTENPGRIVLVDVGDWADAEAAVTEAARRNEPQLALRSEQWLAPRLVRVADERLDGADRIDDAAWRLITLGEGTLDKHNFALQAWPESERPLLPTEVRIGVRCTGVNFRDALIALGMYPDPAANVGVEGAGVVLEVGADVLGLGPGDKVMGMLPGAGPVVVADHRMVTPIPAGLSYPQAAAVPAVFLTAYYSLQDLAHAAAGDRVLVHAATGGVGMAAVQLARRWGLEVYATASPGKWDRLRDMGFDDDHIANSRTTDFERSFAEFFKAADLDGMNIVLNSLAGEFVDASLRLLSNGGRFVELGKADIRSADEVAATGRGIVYRLCDLFEAGPERIQEMLAELGKLFESGELQPLPVRAFDIRQAPDAYRFISHARHVGKLVLTVPTPLNLAGTVLITGGTGVLGAVVARHLVTQYGVRNLLLTSRSGSLAEGAAAITSELSELGASVKIVSCDAADIDQLADLLAGIPADHPLTMVVHAAGALDDAVFAAQTPDSLHAVLRPKLDAAWNLHQLTAGADLSAFVLFSSAAGLVGSPGQANYAAGNAFLDGLAHHRRTNGQAAVSLAWGWWAQATGMTGHLGERDRARMSRGGFVPMSIDDGLALLDAALRQPRALVVPAQLDLAGHGAQLQLAGHPPISPVFTDLLHTAPRAADQPAADSAADLRLRLVAMTATCRERELLEIVRTNAAAVLGYDGIEMVGATQTFKELGFDSLGAVEFRNRLKLLTGLKMSTTAIFDHPTPKALAQYLSSTLENDTVSAAGSADTSARQSWPLTAYQRDVVVIGARYPDLPVAQVAACARLDGAPDLDWMQQCLHRTYLRNDALRLRLEHRGNEFVQSIGTEHPALEYVDFTEQPDPEAACERWIADESRRVLGLDGPLTRAAVLVDRADSFVVFGCFHHAVGDGWGMNLAMNQLLTEYATRTAGTDEPGPSYLDVLRTEQEYRSSPDWAADRQHFVDQFRDVEPALFGRRAPVRTRRRLRHTLQVSSQRAQRIRSVHRSVFACTAAAIGEYLRRVHGGGDIVIGVPFLNRSTDTELATVGDMVNMLPLQIPLEPELSLTDIADRISAQVWDLQARQRFAYGDLAAALHAGAGAPPALFDVTYSYSVIPDTEHAEWMWKDMTVLSSGYSLDAVNIVVRDHERDGSLEVELFYADDVFDADYRFADALRQVVTLLERSIDAHQTSIADIEMLSDDDRAELKVLGSGAVVEFPREMTLDRLADDAPAEAVAMVSATGSLSYAQFDAAVDWVATALHNNGVEPDECIAVIVPRSAELLVAVHGILRAGGAYVPIDPQYPQLRIRSILTDCGARIIIAGDEYAEIATELGIQRLAPTIPADGTAVPSRMGRAVTPVVSPHHLAYVIYTSGSTGQPKGVMVEHRSVINRLSWMQRRYPLSADDVILQKTPATFDVSVWELMWWALAGARVAVLEPRAERDPRKIVDAIERYRVTVIHFVPSMLVAFLDQLEQQTNSLRCVASLRTVFCSGEALAPELVERFNRVFGIAAAPPKLVNLYGPTEATVDVSFFDCPSDGPVATVPIGKPIDNVTLLICDDDGNRCSVGVPGELNIAGVALARGYRGAEELTAAAFVRDDRVPGGRRYRTGDVARWLADGNIEYLGRTDDQVKVRGNRVNLGEVQAALLSCPGIRSATVVDEPSPTHGTHLIAYFVGDSVAVDTLADHVAQRLPGFMVPTSFVALAALPLTASGKVDRQALLQHSRPERLGTAPRTPTEAILVDVFSAVLGVDSIGIHDNFFTVGGDSILALAVRSNAEQRGIILDVEELFARPTIAEVAESVSEIASDGEAGVAEPFAMVPLIDRAALHDAEDAFPATAMQLGMLFHSVARADSTMYKDVFVYRIAMPWRETEFRDAFDRAVQRHPALRSSFELTGYSVPLQIVRTHVASAFDVVSDADDAQVHDYVTEQRARSYELDRAPLYRLRAFPRGDSVDLVLAFHHALLDGWSVANLMRELLQDYLFHLGVDIAPIDAGEHSTSMLAEYVRLEQEAAGSSAAQQFWRDALNGSHATTLPALVAYEPPGTADPDISAVLPEWLHDAAQRLAASRGLAMKSLLLAAHCLTLRAVTGEADVTTGLITHGRPGRVGAESAAGLFLNTIPIRLADDQRSWMETAESIAGFERSSHRYRRYPLSAIQSDAGRSVVETAFNFVNYHVLADLIAADGVQLAGFEGHEQTNFALLVTAGVDPRTGRLSIRASGDPARVTVGQAHDYVAGFVRVLTAIVRSPDHPVNLCVPESVARDVTQLVARQAAATPDAVALVADDGSWTYSELDCSADRIAAGLLAAGLPPEACVGVRLERSPELIAAVLGVLKAGAAVLPLDPSYPGARIDAMTKRAKPFRVLSDIAEVNALLQTRQTAVLPEIRPDSAAYVLFTSGSTGEPKGVIMPHRALANLIVWQNQRASGAVGGSTLQFAPLSFDVSLQEIFSTLAGGGSLRLLSEKRRRDLVGLVRVVADEGIERLFLPFVALQAFAEAAHTTGTPLPSLRVLISSGEQLRITPEIRWLCSANPGLVLENQYGPTETHVATSYTMTGPPEKFPALPPIGTAIDGVTISLRGADMKPVPRGATGEIYLGGRCVASGYQGRPDLTAERFVAVGESRLYRTGDLGAELPSGDVVYLGRVDTQVKVRGFRVECHEVEVALMNLRGSAIHAAAVVAQQRESIDSVLVAYLVGDAAATDIAVIRERLREVLPTHMVPDRFVWLSEFPLTPSGKRDDKALREMRLPDDTHRTKDTAPRATIERAVAELMAEFAGCTEFAADTNFFEAGGTSIGAMRVALAIARTWDVEITLDVFIDEPTPAGIARRIASDGSVRVFDPVVALRTTGERPPLFLVHPIGGNVLCYLDLVKRLPTDQPVYALQAAGAQPGATPLRTVAEMAASYLAAIRRVCPTGPYHVGGWSFGGYVAIEMARQLDNAELGRLILLDTIALGSGPRQPIPEKDLITWFFADLMWAANDGDGAQPPALNWNPDAGSVEGEDMFDSIRQSAVEAGIIAENSSPQMIRRLYDIFYANYQATLNYHHESLDCDITLLRSREELPLVAEGVHKIVGSMFASPTNGWERLTPRSLTTVDVAGDHLSMMSEPNVADVAAKLTATLDAYRADHHA